MHTFVRQPADKFGPKLTCLLPPADGVSSPPFFFEAANAQENTNMIFLPTSLHSFCYKLCIALNVILIH